MSKIQYTVFFLLYSLIINQLGFTQDNGKPFMEIYPTEQNGASPQNWYIVEDNRGIIYIANQTGNIIELDGTNWRLIPIKNISSIRSLAVNKNGRIYVGGTNEFGYLKPDPQGNLNYKSLLFLVDTAFWGFNEIWSINILNDKVFFQARTQLFLFENNQIRHWNLPDIYHRSFVIHDNYYLRQEGIGLTKFEEDTFTLVPNSEFFANRLISAMIPFSEHEILIGTRTKGLFLFDETNNQFNKFENETDEFLGKNFLYHGIKFGENQFAFATLRNGVVILDKSGKLLRSFTKNNGLSSNTTYYIHNQNDQCLWIATSTQVTRVDIGYPIEFWDDNYGFDGIIYDIKKVNNILYLATGQSLYYLSLDNITTDKFKKFKKINEVVWRLLKFKIPCKKNTQKYQLLASTNIGIHSISGQSSKLIEKLENVRSFCVPAKKTNLIFFGSRNKLYQLSYNCNSGKWNKPQELISLSGIIRYINEDNEQNIWIGTAYSGLYKINFNQTNNNYYAFNQPYKIQKYTLNDGLPTLSDVSLHKIDNELVFFTDSGLYRLNKEIDKFFPDTLINNQLTNRDISFMKQDIKGNVWIDGDELLMKQIDNSFKNDSMRFKRIQHFSLFGSLAEENGDTWFGARNLYKTNLKDSLIYNDNYSTLIRNVIANDSILFGGTFFNDSNFICLNQNDLFKPELDYKYNSISFEFSAPYFVEQENVEYSCILEGFDKSWSEWTNKTKKEYTNLNEGEYIFKVKANCVFDIESEIATYAFKINPPWHRSIFAFIFYVILLILLIIIIVRIYTKRLKQANIKLENIVKDRTVEIREKNKELTKLSIVASETDNAIVIMDAEGNYEWFNDAHKRLFGYEYAEFIKTVGNNILMISTNDQIKEIVADCIKYKKSVIYESKGISKSGKNFFTQVTLTPVLSKNGEVEKLVTIEADIRKLKEYEKEILQQKDEIEAQKDEIETQRDHLAEANATKDKFFSIISHDLKSPFNSILGFSEMLVENIPVLTKDKIIKFSEQIYNSSKQLYSLVENLLSWSRAKSNKIVNSPEKIDLKDLVNTLLMVSKLSAQGKSIQISQQVPKNIYGFADENLVSTIIRNLLSNAIKYSNENGLITIKAVINSDFIEISVIDSGIGIKKDDINKLFRENVHYTTKGTDQEKGTGLGLILCKNFVEICGGKIWVDSVEGKGSTFTFTIPKYKKSLEKKSE